MPPLHGEESGNWVGNYFEQLRQALYPGCVVVVESGGEQHAGKFGEMTSWALKQGGAHGIVLDSFIRDWLGLEVIPNFTPCARGTSPIESHQRWRMTAVNSTIGMPGTLTSARPGHARGLDHRGSGWRDGRAGSDRYGSTGQSRRC